MEMYILYEVCFTDRVILEDVIYNAMYFIYCSKVET